MDTLSSLETADLSCVRGGRLVFRGLDFRGETGEAVALEGANGSGKTSLLRMLAGFLAPAAGAISFETQSGAIADGEERGKLCGWLGHHDGVKPQMTPRETLAFFAALYATSVTTALDEAGLARIADLPCQYLSAGQKKRVALARLKLSARPLWLLDEPLSALDTQGKALLRAMIASHCANGGIVVAATHDPLGVACRTLVLA